MTKILRVLLCIVGGCLLILIGALCCSFIYFQSESGSKFILNHLNQILSHTTQFQIKYRVGRVYPLSSIHFEDLEIIRNPDAPTSSLDNFQFRSKSFDLQYSLSLWSRTLTIEAGHLESPSLNITQKPVDDKDPNSESKKLLTQSKDADSQLLPDSFRVLVKTFKIQNLEMNLKQIQSESETRTEIHQVNLDMNLKWMQDQLHLEGNALLNTGPFLFYKSSRTGNTQASFESHQSSMKISLEKDVKIDLDSVVKNLKSSAGISKPVDFEIHSGAELSFDLSNVKAQGTTLFDHTPFLNFNLTAQNNSSDWDAQGEVEVKAHPKWMKTLYPDFKSLPPQVTALLPMDLKTQLNMSMKSGIAESSGSTWLSQIQLKEFKKPVQIDHQLRMDSGGQSQVQIQVNAPDLELLPIGRLLNTSFQTHLNFTGKDRIELKDFSGTLNQAQFALKAESTHNLATKNFQTQGHLRLHFPKGFIPTSGHTIEGDLELPWTLSMYRGRDIFLEGKLALKDFHWTKIPSKASPAALRILGLTGRIPVSEQFILEGGLPKLAKLIHQNPFERVDFERLQPMIHESEQVDIQKIQYEDKSFGPFQGFFSMRQNFIFAHQFDLKLGTGRTHGELFIDLNPSQFQIGFLSRLTELDLVEILPERYLLKNRNLNQGRLSGRAGIVVQLNSGNMDGKIDVTEIGKEQLMTLINAVDPKYENEQLNRARFALGLAYPSYIQMSFQKGYMNLNFQIQGVVNQKFYITGIPVTPWVSQATSKWVSK